MPNRIRKVVQMGAPHREIRQRDLIELAVLRKEASEAKRRWEHKREEIRQALRDGAEVESGLLVAKIKVQRVLKLG